MSLLGTKALPTTVLIGGAEYPINSDFRAGIKFETLIFDRRIPEEAKLRAALDVWYGEEWPTESDLSLVIDAMLTFYRCGKPEIAGTESREQLYSYEYDYDLIFAAFLSVYGLDLFEVDGLHWWRFKAMLTALPADTQLMKVIGYRATPDSRKMSKEQRAHLRKMKRVFALPEAMVSRPARIESDDAFEAALAAVIAAKTGEVRREE